MELNGTRVSLCGQVRIGSAAKNCSSDGSNGTQGSEKCGHEGSSI